MPFFVIIYEKNEGERSMKLSEVDRSKLSPMMNHYVELKDNYIDVILLYRLGDFYEMFF